VTTFTPHSARIGRLVVLATLVVAGLFAFVVMQPKEIFTANTPTGGDMGAHVLVPAFLRDTLLPSGRLMGWSMDWYAGFPALYFYFPLPALTIVALDVLLPYGVAFKLVTVAGLVALPGASYFFARGMGFSRPVATVGGIAGSSFAFMESYTIYGGNTLSTMAGEYSFSWSLALSLVYLGIVIRNVREGKGFTLGAAIALALTALSHVITTLVVVLASIPLLLRRRGPAAVVGAWTVGFGLTAFWALPLLARLGYTNSMNWHPVRDLDVVFARPLWPMLLLAVGGFAWAISRRMVMGPALALMVVPVVAFYLIEYIDYRELYNPRLLPYFYFTTFLFAGLFVGMLVVGVVRRFGVTPLRLWGATALASAVFLVVAGLGIAQATNWARWNFTGYEGKQTFPEYQALMETISELPPGRVMWEGDNALSKYGTSMALMLTGYWSEGHPSMEGLLFESSITVPFHFLTVSETSKAKSGTGPVSGLRYRSLDFGRGVPHMALYGVDYYVSFSEAARVAAEDAGLEKLATTGPFAVFDLPDAPLVEPATLQPAVWAGDAEFQDAAIEWFDDVTRLDHWIAEDGPDDWPRVTEISAADVREPIAGTYEVSDIEIDHHHVSFSTTGVGVPHVVKVSYFPNWQADGAEGPWRVTPSLMVVVPTQEDVVLAFRHTPAEYAGLGLSVVTYAGIAAWFLVQHRRRREAPAVESESIEA